MPLEFSHITLGQRVLFGAGQAASHLAEEVQRLNAQRIMLIASASKRDLAQRVAAEIDVVVNYDNVVMHVPIEVARMLARWPARTQWICWSVWVAGLPPG